MYRLISKLDDVVQTCIKYLKSYIELYPEYCDPGSCGKISFAVLVADSNVFSNRHKRLFAVSYELNKIFFIFPFKVPDYFALLTRALIVLEGIAVFV